MLILRSSLFHVSSSPTVLVMYALTIGVSPVDFSVPSVLIIRLAKSGFWMAVDCPWFCRFRVTTAGPLPSSFMILAFKGGLQVGTSAFALLWRLVRRI